MRYSGLSPSTAKALAVRTMKALDVMAKIAGMESTVKSASVVPTTIMTASRSVA